MSQTSFLEHLEALRRALWKSVAAVAVMLVPGIWLAPYVMTQIIRYACPAGVKLHYFSPMEPFIAELQLGLVLALFGASPVILYQAGAFIAPGLHPAERRWTGRFLTASLILLISGAALGFFGVVPIVMKFSFSFASEAMAPVIGLENFLHLVLILILGFAVIFQLPVLLLLLVAAGLVKPETLRRTRPVTVVLIFVAAGVLTPPDVLSQLLMAIPAWLLFEAALLVSSRLAPKPAPQDEEELLTPAEMPESVPEPVPDDLYEEPPPEYKPYRKKRRIRPL